MRLYQCDVSGIPLYFCNHLSVGANSAPVGFVADSMTMHTLYDITFCTVADIHEMVARHKNKRWLNIFL